jgi:hypothetical protein
MNSPLQERGCNGAVKIVVDFAPAPSCPGRSFVEPWTGKSGANVGLTDLTFAEQAIGESPDDPQITLDDPRGSRPNFGLIEVVIGDQGPAREAVGFAAIQPGRPEFPKAGKRGGERYNRPAAARLNRIETRRRPLARRAAAIGIEAGAADTLTEHDSGD